LTTLAAEHEPDALKYPFRIEEIMVSMAGIRMVSRLKIPAADLRGTNAG